MSKSNDRSVRITADDLSAAQRAIAEAFMRAQPVLECRGITREELIKYTGASNRDIHNYLTGGIASGRLVKGMIRSSQNKILAAYTLAPGVRPGKASCADRERVFTSVVYEK